MYWLVFYMNIMKFWQIATVKQPCKNSASGQREGPSLAQLHLYNMVN